MAVRTTTTAVRDLLGRDYDTNRSPSLTVHVQTASKAVDLVVVLNDEEGGDAVDSDTLELMERWTAAYCYTRTDSLYSQRSTLSASGAFLRPDDAYLQGAKLVDPTGLLEAVLSKNVATMTWGGKTPSEAIDWVDRDANP